MVIKGAFAGYSLAVKQITYDSLVIKLFTLGSIFYNANDSGTE